MELKKISIFETAPLTVYKSFYWNPLLSLFLTDLRLWLPVTVTFLIIAKV